MPTQSNLLSLLRNSATQYLTLTIHSHLLKTALLNHPPFPVTLLNSYSQSHHVLHAIQLFDEIPHRDRFLWSALLSYLVRSKRPLYALSLLPTMTCHDSVAPDHFIYSTLATACAHLRAPRQGKQIHARVLCSSYSGDDVVKSSLVNMYGKCGLVSEARRVFDTVRCASSVCWTAMVSSYASKGMCSDAVCLLWALPEKQVVAWTAVISGFVQSGCGVEAVMIFLEMLREGVRMHDCYVFTSVVSAAANLGALELGRQLHCLVVLNGYETSLFVGNALVDMYAKCGDILRARAVFDSILVRDTMLWTTMIVGEAQHGRARDALALFKTMVKSGVSPNEVTFVGLLHACSHVGLVQEGRELFESMVRDYAITPSLQHYTCILDLLSRSGYLSEAEEFMKDMRFEPDEAMWASLLCACKRFSDTQRSIRIANNLLNSKPKYPCTYILLSNTFAVAKKWDCVAKVRMLMEGIEVKKEAGYSWIEVGKESYKFLVGVVPVHMRDSIFGILSKLTVEMKKRGYVPDYSCVMHDIEEQEKEQQLFLHSERLAVAFGLLKAASKVPIRIVKNLRVCRDCHNALKLISGITRRTIVVRDSNRFHHFRDGVCSCGDFW